MTTSNNYAINMDETIMEITNNMTKFRIINNTDSLPFIFSNEELSNIQISEPSTVFQGEDSIKIFNLKMALIHLMTSLNF